MKLLTAESLPSTEDTFFDLLKIWFPTVYDIKYLMKASKALKGGLQEVADDLGVRAHDFLDHGILTHLTGSSNRDKPTSRIGFTSYSIYVLQDAGDLL